jgi:putative ABC transport system ATP-binding protein
LTRIKSGVQATGNNGAEPRRASAKPRRGVISAEDSDQSPDQVAERPVFIARGLSKVYGTGDARVFALRDISLEIRQGEFLVLLGPSGSGKSTLLNILGGLDAPTSGTATWRDHRLTGASDTELTTYRREHVGFVFQFYNLIPNLTVRENVRLVAQIASNPMRPEQALELVGLTHRLDHFPSQLSGGEQQRVAVARAIVKRPDILLCDEPTGALDADTGRLVLAAIAKVNAELGTTTVVITHNSAIAGMASRILRLSGGRIAREEVNPTRIRAEDVTW